MTVLAVIPARGGSKGIPRKNLVLLHGRPLIAYSIVAGLESQRVDRTWVSTDDDEIAEVSRALGAEVPFMRPPNLSNDQALMLGVLQHALEWHERVAGPVEAIVLLQPTSPLRQARHIDQAVDLFRASGASSVVSVVEVPHQFSPVSLMTLGGGYLMPFMGPGKTITRRQDKPKIFARNGPAVLVCDPQTLKTGELYGERCIPYEMTPKDSLDVDGPEDLIAVEAALSASAKIA